MADRERDPETKDQQESPEFVIPDGGLSTSMPAWLLQRPNWATSDTPTGNQPVELEMSAGIAELVEATMVVRELPPPDASPIHLADVLTVDDLPDWLRAVADRAERDRAAGEPAVEEAAPSEGASEMEVATVAVEPAPVPTVMSAISASDSSGRSQMVIGGMIAAVALVVIYLILSLTGVI